MSRVQQFPLPDLGEGLTEGEILKWLVGVGETVTLNQPIVEVETAKAAVEIPAKWAGRVTAIFRQEGEMVEVGTPIIAIDTRPDEGPPRQETPGGRTPVLVGYGPRGNSTRRRPQQMRDRAQHGPAGTVDTSTVLAKPPVRKLARDLGVDLHDMTGSGPLGSITREDVLAAHAAWAAAAVPPQTARGAATTTAQRPASAAPSVGRDREQRIPLKGARRAAAENMVASAFTAPHATEFLTLDITRTMRVLGRLRELPEWQGIRISPLLLVAKAVLVATRRHPMINSTLLDDQIVVKEYVNLGIATATERGLVVPNIKDAGRLSTRELAETMSNLITAARQGRVAPADMTGGTFAITNVGVFGVDTGTPILPPGEAAILALGTVREMPWVHKKKIKVRQVTTLALSFDHRIVDGELGSKFLRDVGLFLTDPETALLAWD